MATVPKEKLTKEFLQAYADQQTAIYLSTEPTDEEHAWVSICEAYKVAKLPEPKNIIWYDSPKQFIDSVMVIFMARVSANVMARVSRSGLDSVEDSVVARVWDRVEDSVEENVTAIVVGDFWDRVRSSVKNSVGSDVWDRVSANVVASVGSSVVARVRDSVMASVEESIKESVEDSVVASVIDSVVASVWDSVVDSVEDSVKDSVVDSVWGSVKESVGNSVKDSVGSDVWDRARSSVRDSVEENVTAIVAGGVWDSVKDSVWESVKESVEASVRDSVRRSVWDSVRDGVKGRVRSSVKDSVEDRVWDGVVASVWDGVRKSVWDSVGKSIEAWYGAPYNALLKFFNDHQEQNDFRHICAFDEQVTGYLLTADTVHAVRKPIRLVRNPAGRLHYDHDKAIEWADGYGFYYLNGIEFDQNTWQKIVDEKFTLSDLAKGDLNAEQRAVAVSMLRADRLLKQVNAEKIGTGKRGVELYKVPNFMNTGNTEYCMKLEHPSIKGKYYIEWVEPKLGKKGDVDECMARSRGITKEQYLTAEIA
jgi:hypothetical protein